MTMKPAEWQQATDALHQANTILVVTHMGPDGDAIGSALGLGNAIRQLGKDVTVAVDDGVPDYLAFLPNAADIQPQLVSGSWDLMISTDSSDEERTGNVGIYGRANSKKVINIDHHVTNTFFGDIHVVVPTAVSATEIVHDWWQFAQVPLNREIAMPLLAGLVTDTLGFRVSTVTSKTLNIAQNLMDAGASLTEVTARTLDSKTFQELRLWQRVLPSAQLDGQVLEATIRLEDYQAVGMDDLDDAGLVSFLNQINEAMVAVVFKQVSDAETRISLRSKRGYDVSEVAFALGGGGHRQASGATVHGSLEEARAKVLPLLHAATAKGKLDIV